MSSTPTAPAAGSRKIAIIGAGAMGLVAAYHAAKAGYDVTVYEADKKPGGMAAHFDFGGLSIERYYHFVCKADQPLFDILEEVGLGDAMVWKDTSMGYFFNGALHNWGDPISLLRFPGIGLIDKIRYGLHAFYSTKRSDWEKIDGLRADAWIKAWIGQKAYDVLWKKLFELKFYHYAENVSASWIWTRIKRVGTSRKSMMQEQLGYIEGGSETLVHRLVEKIEGMGGKIVLGAPVQEIRLSDGPNNSKKVEGVATPEGFEAFDNVISTVPMPYVGAMIPDLPPTLKAQYETLPNIGVICVIHKLRKPVTKHFWVNTNDPRMDIPGIVAFSNLRDTSPDHIVYVPYYMPNDLPRFQEPLSQFIDQSRAFLKMINPDLTDEDFIDAQAGRLKYAQPVCPPSFLDMLPDIAPAEVSGLMVADTSFYYPEDRGISEGARLAKEMVACIGTGAQPRKGIAE